eukprot:GHVR01177646.1.p1 GENE.GHVR01177646.1~~GHVR01177646.1.p1  ORF type:complete len:142 (+),score=5.38 GHVR01177646.1:914-1339(+)
MINTYKFEKIIKDFDARIRNPNGYPLKWTFLSGHDTDTIPAQVDLNISSSQCIEELYRKGSTSALNCLPNSSFASSIFFELHSDNSKDYYVMIRYNGKYINLCEQKDTKCSYNDWKARLKKVMISNVEELCGNHMTQNIKP